MRFRPNGTVSASIFATNLGAILRKSRSPRRAASSGGATASGRPTLGAMDANLAALDAFDERCVTPRTDVVFFSWPRQRLHQVIATATMACSEPTSSASARNGAYVL